MTPPPRWWVLDRADLCTADDPAEWPGGLTLLSATCRCLLDFGEYGDCWDLETYYGAQSAVICNPGEFDIEDQSDRAHLLVEKPAICGPTFGPDLIVAPPVGQNEEVETAVPPDRRWDTWLYYRYEGYGYPLGCV